MFDTGSSELNEVVRSARSSCSEVEARLAARAVSSDWWRFLWDAIVVSISLSLL